MRCIFAHQVCVFVRIRRRAILLCWPREEAGMPSVKEAQLKHWDAVADGWAAWRDWTERNFQPLTGWFREAAGWRPGARALDVAGGPGYPALAAARLVRPGGRVIATDLSPAMVDATAQGAAAAGLDNVTCRVMDAEQLALDDEAVDAVTNAYGLMFCPEPPRALREAYRVLAPGGRVAVATWAEPSASPFFTIITGIAAPRLGLQPPDADAPGPFRLSSPDALASTLRDAGFAGVRVSRLPMTFELASADEYVQVFADVAWKARVDALTPADRTGFREAVADAVRPHVIDGRLRLGTSTLCASGEKR
jgi:SAM-dependent methyltransferase